MKYFLLNEQDIDEILWDVENFIFLLKEKLEEKKLKSDDEEED